MAHADSHGDDRVAPGRDGHLGRGLIVPDEQDVAEAFDEEQAFGAEQATSDLTQPIDPLPERPMGLPFADADITDESVSDRVDREEPEVWENRAVSGEDADVLEMADPLEIREGVEIVRDIDLDELPDDEG